MKQIDRVLENGIKMMFEKVIGIVAIKFNNSQVNEFHKHCASALQPMVDKGYGFRCEVKVCQGFPVKADKSVPVGYVRIEGLRYNSNEKVKLDLKIDPKSQELSELAISSTIEPDGKMSFDEWWDYISTTNKGGCI